MKVNITSLRELATDHAFLFADFQELVLKANEDLDALIKVRIHDHEQAEAQKRQGAEAQAKAMATPVAPASQPEPAPQAQQSVPVTQTAHSSAAVDDGQRIKLGDINGRLGFNLTGDFLRSIGFEAVGRERAAVLYRAAAICSALINHIQQAQQSRTAA